MKITGIITNVMPLQTGVSAQGNEWKRQTIVVREDNPDIAFPDEIALDVWNDKIPDTPLATGIHVEVFAGIRTRTYNDKVFNDINVFKLIIHG